MSHLHASSQSGPVPTVPAAAEGTISLLPLAHGELLDRRADAFPTSVSGWLDGPLDLPADATHYGYVHRGSVTIRHAGMQMDAPTGCYFALPGAATLTPLDGDGGVGDAGSGLVVSRHAFRGLFQVGGPVERVGRLRYIDGCSDTLLVHPPVLGDPCLNYLYFPPGIDQTLHTHPSLRAGLILAGEGECRLPGGVVPLRPGMVFLLEPDAIHGFRTGDHDMRIVVYHPDSDCGPSHDDHPMLNRTIVDGVSAAKLDAIRTRDL